MKGKLTASNLRIILIVSILIIAAASAFGFSYGINYIQKYAGDVSKKKIDAQASNGTIASLQGAQEKLDATKDVKEKLQLLKSTSDFPEFRIYDEVKSVAQKNGIEIDSFSYGDATTASSTTQAQPATPAGTPTATIAPSTSNVVSLTVKLKSPVSYQSYLQFLYDIEQRLPILKVESISLTAGQSSSSVTADQLTIQMYKK